MDNFNLILCFDFPFSYQNRKIVANNNKIKLMKIKLAQKNNMP